MRVLTPKNVRTSAKGGTKAQYFSSEQITAKAIMQLKSVLLCVAHPNQSLMIPVQSVELCVI